MTECRGSLEWVCSCYGVDLQAGRPVVVRAERSRGHVDCFPVSFADPSFARALQGGKVVAAGSLTAGESLSCWLELPFAARQKALKVLPALLDVQLPFALEDCAYEFIEAGRKFPAAGRQDAEGGVVGKARALAVAARFSDIEKKIEAFKAFGIDPVVLDHEGLALWTQSLAELPVAAGFEHVPRVVVCLGSEHSALAIGCGEEFISAHSIGQDNAGQISRLLKAQLKPAQGKLEAEVRWMWAGTGAQDAGLLKKLQEALRSEWPGPSVVHDKPETFLARALATRALTGGPLRCNLRSGPLLHAFISGRAKKEHVRTALVYLAAGIMLCVMNLAWVIMTGRKESGFEEAIGSLKDRLAGYHVTAKGENGIKVVREVLNPRRELLRPFVRSFDPSLVETIVSLADLAKKNDLRYETVSISREKVNVGGTAGNGNKCEILKNALKQKGYSVKLDRKESLADERVVFSVITTGANNE